MGVAILGDSAGAHFSLPVDWLRPYNWTVDSQPFLDWKIAVGNELDWPMMSAFTGFTDKCWSNAPNSFIDDTNVDSIYSRLVQRNRCNLNDYQNQANNGCKARSMADKTIKGLNRNRTDKPMLVFLSLIGNDVCNGKVSTQNGPFSMSLESHHLGQHGRLYDYPRRVQRKDYREFKIS